MATNPSSDVALVACRGCSKDVYVPKGTVLASRKAGKDYITFCSRRCERKWISKEGLRQAQENRKMKNAEHLDADPS